jgi:hypothetical protein
MGMLYFLLFEIPLSLCQFSKNQTKSSNFPFDSHKSPTNSDSGATICLYKQQKLLISTVLLKLLCQVLKRLVSKRPKIY